MLVGCVSDPKTTHPPWDLLVAIVVSPSLPCQGMEHPPSHPGVDSYLNLPTSSNSDLPEKTRRLSNSKERGEK